MKLKSDEIRRCRQEIRRIKTGLKNFWCDAKRIKCSAKKLKLHLLLKQFAKLRLLVTDKVSDVATYAMNCCRSVFFNEVAKKSKCIINKHECLIIN